MYEKPRVNVKVERVLTFTYTHYLPYIVSVSFKGVKLTRVRTQGEISRQWKPTLDLFPWDVKFPEGLELAHTSKPNARTNDDEARNGQFLFLPSTHTLFTSVNRDHVNPSWRTPSAMLECGMFSPCVYHYACTCFWPLSWQAIGNSRFGKLWTRQVLISIFSKPVFRCVSLLWSWSGLMIRDHSDHGRSNEPMNPCPEWIHRFIWSQILIRIISKERTLDVNVVCTSRSLSPILSRPSRSAELPGLIDVTKIPGWPRR